MILYAAERDIADQIKASSSVVCASQAHPADAFDIKERSLAKLKAHASANPDQLDLYYLKSVLVSTGCNKNDDVFDPQEVWAARTTPEDKPFNLEHDQRDIIGHITGTRVLDSDGKAVASDAVVEEIPTTFDVINEAVLYKFWADKTLQERMDATIAEIADGKWFVSMEVLFNRFDYRVGDKVIARTEDTAFLTKHLRAYGGDGTYEGQPIVRVLRSLTFSGVALVKKPANPNSVILSDKAVASTTMDRTRADIADFFSVDKQEESGVPRKASGCPVDTLSNVQRGIASYFSRNDV
jgi:hypothetical protein